MHLQPCQQHLCIGSQALRFSHSGIFASAARPCGSVTVALLASKSFPIALRHGALASNKPHPAEKSTPVWLPIWCTWAGFANSQLRCATFQSTYSYKCTSSLMPTWSRCSDIANLSAHLPRLPTPPPYLRRTRLLPGWGAGIRCWRLLPFGWGCRCLVLDMAATRPGASFLQITARTNPCSRHLWGTLARAVASICAHRARLQKLIVCL